MGCGSSSGGAYAPAESKVELTEYQVQRAFHFAAVRWRAHPLGAALDGWHDAVQLQVRLQKLVRRFKNRELSAAWQGWVEYHEAEQEKLYKERLVKRLLNPMLVKVWQQWGFFIACRRQGKVDSRAVLEDVADEAVRVVLVKLAQQRLALCWAGMNAAQRYWERVGKITVCQRVARGWSVRLEVYRLHKAASRIQATYRAGKERGKLLEQKPGRGRNRRPPSIPSALRLSSASSAVEAGGAGRSMSRPSTAGSGYLSRPSTAGTAAGIPSRPSTAGALSVVSDGSSRGAAAVESAVASLDPGSRPASAGVLVSQEPQPGTAAAHAAARLSSELRNQADEAETAETGAIAEQGTFEDAVMRRVSVHDMGATLFSS
eukprot:SAG22_NODE_3972_length_1444_cov_1.750929_1_plen_373_part_10